MQRPSTCDFEMVADAATRPPLSPRPPNTASPEGSVASRIAARKRAQLDASAAAEADAPAATDPQPQPQPQQQPSPAPLLDPSAAGHGMAAYAYTQAGSLALQLQKRLGQALAAVDGALRASNAGGPEALAWARQRQVNKFLADLSVVNSAMAATSGARVRKLQGQMAAGWSAVGELRETVAGQETELHGLRREGAALSERVARVERELAEKQDKLSEQQRGMSALLWWRRRTEVGLDATLLLLAYQLSRFPPLSWGGLGLAWLLSRPATRRRSALLALNRACVVGALVAALRTALSTTGVGALLSAAPTYTLLLKELRRAGSGSAAEDGREMGSVSAVADDGEGPGASDAPEPPRVFSPNSGEIRDYGLGLPAVSPVRPGREVCSI